MSAFFLCIFKSHIFYSTNIFTNEQWFLTIEVDPRGLFDKEEHGEAFRALEEAARLLKYGGFDVKAKLLAEKGPEAAVEAIAQTCKSTYAKVRDTSLFLSKIEELA
jgi:hypothetical protein